MQYLPRDGGPLRLAYLADPGDAAAHGTILSGRWPVAAGEVALPTSTARALALDVGSTTTLAAEPGGPGPTLTVVGTFVPRPGAAWAEDPLNGAGTGPHYRGSIVAYGPFVVAPGALATSDVPLRRVTLRVQPDMAHATAADVASAGAAVDALGGELQSELGDRTQNVVVDLPFASTIDGARAQRGVTSSGVLSVALLGGALAGTTVLLAARLVAARRASEVVLLVARGASRRRLVAQASAEAAVLAALCIAPATALALVVFRMLSNAVGLGPAGISEGGLLQLVAVVTAVALSLGALLVLPWLRSGTSRGGREDRVGLVARSGADLLLLALAVLAYLQLRDHGIATGAAADPLLVVGPVLCLLAGAAIALRPLPMLARRADARRRVCPLAGPSARRLGRSASTAGCRGGVPGGAGDGVRDVRRRVQRDLGAVRARAGGGRRRHRPVGARTRRGAGYGHRTACGHRWARQPGHEPDRDSRLAHAARRRQRCGWSRSTRGTPTACCAATLPAGGWADATKGLAPSEPVGGVRLTGPSADLVVSGHVADGVSITAALSLVVQDRDGARAALPAGVVALDGAPHALTVAVPRDVQVVAVDARLTAAGAGDPDQQTQTPFVIDVTLRDATLSPGGSWTAARPTTTDQVAASLDDITAAAVPDGVRLTLDGTASFPELSWTDGALTALAFRPVDVVPVVVSATAGRRAGPQGRRRPAAHARSDAGARQGQRHQRLRALAATRRGAAGRRRHVVPRCPQPRQSRDADRRVVGRRHDPHPRRRHARGRGNRPGDRPRRRGAGGRRRALARCAAGGRRAPGRSRPRAHARRHRAALDDRAPGARARRGPPARAGRVAALRYAPPCSPSRPSSPGFRSSSAACWVASPAGRWPPCWRCPLRGFHPCRQPP